MDNNFKKVSKVLWIILFANLTVALVKILIGSLVKSVSITADGFHSLTDGASNIVGLIGINIASKPVDECHPYGHRKFETLAGLFISAMLFIMGVNIVMEGIDRIINPIMPDISFQSIIILIVTILTNIVICIYEYNMGKKLKSQILISDSMHTRSDLFVSLGVLLTVISIKLGLPQIIDLLASFIVAAFIFHAGYDIFKYNRDILVDRAVVDVDKVRNIVLSFEQVKGIHNIRSRGNEEDVYIDMHIMIEPNLSVEKSHELIHSIEERISEDIKKNVQLFTHIEPYYSIDK